MTKRVKLHALSYLIIAAVHNAQGKKNKALAYLEKAEAEDDFEDTLEFLADSNDEGFVVEDETAEFSDDDEIYSEEQSEEIDDEVLSSLRRKRVIAEADSEFDEETFEESEEDDAEEFEDDLEDSLDDTLDSEFESEEEEESEEISEVESDDDAEEQTASIKRQREKLQRNLAKLRN